MPRTFKIDLEIQVGKWRLNSSNSIHIYELKDDLDDIVLKNVVLERKGNRENEIYNISFDYLDPVLKARVTVRASTKEK